MPKKLKRFPAIGKLVIMALLSSATAGTATAQITEQRTRIIVPLPAGGGIDAVSRIVAERMAHYSGQSFIIENKGGAGGRIGIVEAARAPKGGFDLLAAFSGMAAIVATDTNPGFDVYKDFEPIGAIVTLPGIFIGRADLPANNAKELIELIRSRPGEITVARGGILAQLSIELFCLRAGNLKVLQVPHVGSAAVTNAVAGRHVDLGYTDIGSPMSAIQSGLIKGVAVTSVRPVENLPNVPTADSAGLPGFEVGTWVSLYAPSGTPKERIAQLGALLVRALQEPEVIRKIKNLGMIAQAGDVETATNLLTRDISDFTEAAIAAGLRK